MFLVKNLIVGKREVTFHVRVHMDFCSQYILAKPASLYTAALNTYTITHSSDFYSILFFCSLFCPCKHNNKIHFFLYSLTLSQYGMVHFFRI